MRSRTASYIIHKLRVGLRRRCPECELGKLFPRPFRMEKVCPYCGSRFERSSGDMIGGVYLNMVAAQLTALGGFFLIHALFAPPIWIHLAGWIGYVLVFTAVFYPYARGLWVAVLYLTGAVYPDPDYEREYFAPHHVTYGKTPQEHD